MFQDTRTQKYDINSMLAHITIVWLYLANLQASCLPSKFSNPLNPNRENKLKINISTYFTKNSNFQENITFTNFMYWTQMVKFCSTPRGSPLPFYARSQHGPSALHRPERNFVSICLFKVNLKHLSKTLRSHLQSFRTLDQRSAWVSGLP